MHPKNGIEIVEDTISNISSTLVNTISSSITFDDTFMKQARLLLSDGSSNSAIIFEVYENERWNALFKEWGNVSGLHLHPLLDRAPYTDTNNTYSANASILKIAPIVGFKWDGDWQAVVEEGKTDSLGHQYAYSWPLLSETINVVQSEESLSTFVRRRKLRRVMVLDNSFSFRNLPFEIHITVKHAFYKQSFGSVSHSHVEVLHKGVLIGSTPSSHPNWNATIVLNLIHLENNEPIEFRLFRRTPLCCTTQ